MHQDFLKHLQRYTAEVCVTASAVRNQGASGVAVAVRRYLTRLKLEEMRDLKAETFSSWLNTETSQLQHSLPPRAQNWGTARKTLNIFLRTVAYTSPLADVGGLTRLVKHFEVPLDSHVANELRKSPEGATLPKWRTIKGLTPNDSGLYQQVAARIAARMDLHRADLDVFYWRS